MAPVGRWGEGQGSERAAPCHNVCEYAAQERGRERGRVRVNWIDTHSHLSGIFLYQTCVK